MREISNTDDRGDGVQVCGEGPDRTDATVAEPAPEGRAFGVGETEEKVGDERQPDDGQADGANVVPPAWKDGLACFVWHGPVLEGGDEFVGDVGEGAADGSDEDGGYAKEREAEDLLSGAQRHGDD